MVDKEFHRKLCDALLARATEFDKDPDRDRVLAELRYDAVMDLKRLGDGQALAMQRETASGRRYVG